MKKLLPRPSLLLGSLFFLNAHAASTLNVLTYSSLLDKGGLGEVILKEASKKKMTVHFTTSKDFAGILGTLRKLKREDKLNSLDLVLGINEAHYKAALSEQLLKEGSVYEEASFSFLANKELLPEKSWPKTWLDVKKVLKNKILVQDPRTSEVGLTWLLNKNLKLEDLKKLPKKIFPNWSSSFEAFETGLAPVIWTYSTSAAYFECSNDPKAKKYANIPLPEYPKDKNFIAYVDKGLAPTKESQVFFKLILSKEVQSEIWQKNWMFPALFSLTPSSAPPCYSKVWFPRDAKEVEALSSKELLNRLDQWSL
ncbi:MAG: hypothetical protein R3A80_00500 [Bdellovibrionota bacterium]